ncbi:MAG TPA: porin [Rhodanobacteraceae bacterium]|nr:porin [Rhodanobacteraceae bacterium]
MDTRIILLAALACTCAGNAQAGGLLNDWPTTFKAGSGYEFAVEGLYQADSNDFSGAIRDPETGDPLFDDATAWRRKELDFRAGTPFGIEVDLGYDWQASWTDNFLEYGSDRAGDFRLGQFKTQVGWESAESADAGTFLEPSLPGQAVYEGRRLGLNWNYDKIGNWLISGALYFGGDLDGNNQGHGWSGRVVYAPLHSDTRVVHFGLAASREHRDDEIAQFDSTPEAGLTQIHLVDSGPLTRTETIDRLGLEAGWMSGPFHAQGEYLRVDARRRGNMPDFRGDGFYAFGSWMLTGESREYEDGEFGNTKPQHAYGAFELALRFSELDLDDGPFVGGKELDWTVGLNWYLGQHFKMQANYVRISSERSPVVVNATDIDPRVFELRTQVYF